MLNLNNLHISMLGLNKIESNKFIETIFIDGSKIFNGFEIKPTEIEIPKNIELDEYQYYVHKVGFYLINTLTWCKQLELSIEFLSNYDYSKKNYANRVDHLIYNIENYLIRLNSIHDRILQLVNAVFHLCISDEHVRHAIIVSNYKVAHRK